MWAGSRLDRHSLVAIVGGNNCQPVRSRLRGRRRVSVVVGIVAALCAGIVVANGRRTVRLPGAIVVALTLVAWGVVLLLALRHAPWCPSV